MASGDKYGMVTGKVTATGAALQVELPFTPRKVEVFNIDNDVSLEWRYPMPNAAGVKVVAAGTQAYITADGITPTEAYVLDHATDKRGFIIGALADINDTTTEELYWVAYA